MDYYTIMDFAADLGYELSMSGAETFRVEDSMARVITSYGIEAEVFAIPSYLIVSIITETGKPLTRMRRIGYHGNNLDAVEKLNALSRTICSQHPEPGEAMKMLDNVRKSILYYGLPVYLLGNFLGAAGFSILFGCSLADMLLAGVCGILGGLINRFMDNMKVNPFFATILSAFVMALTAYGLNVRGIVQNVDGVVIGALMILVPGLLFTNAMRDIIYGDTNSGITRIVQVLLIAMGMALGTAVAWNAAAFLWRQPVNLVQLTNPLLITSLGSLAGCIGFSILFNIHGPGGTLCALGGVLTWVVFDLVLRFSGSELVAYFLGSFLASAYAETMARIRKYPAISYLVVSLFPLIPGAGIYHTMNYAVHGEMELFAAQGMHTAAITGMLAVGVLLVTTIVRLCYTWMENNPTKKGQ
ncbi:MAG: threonine/serine exporter ThrE family protein [Faecousia sp.]